MYVELKNAPEVASLLQNARGDYLKTRVSLVVFKGPMELDSNWSGGSKTYWTLIDLSDGRMLSLGDSGQIGQPQAPKLDALPVNTVLVECKTFRGKALPATIHMHPDNMTKFLPESVSMTDQEKSILSITSRIKSSYREEEFRRAGMSMQTVNTIRQELTAKGLLDKRGAITVAGRNAIGQ